MYCGLKQGPNYLPVVTTYGPKQRAIDDWELAVLVNLLGEFLSQITISDGESCAVRYPGEPWPCLLERSMDVRSLQTSFFRWKKPVDGSAYPSRTSLATVLTETIPIDNHRS